MAKTKRERAAVAVAAPSRRAVFLAAGLIALAVGIAYANSLGGPFIFDDLWAIVVNPTLRPILPLSDFFAFPPDALHVAGLGYSGRPLVKLSFALNDLFGGKAVLGYHLVNLAIHLLAAWVLFGLLWRTLRLPVLAGRFGDQPLLPALAVTLLWAVHPLQTESVTYLLQRAESLAALLTLLTLYAFLRGAEAGNRKGWFVVAFLSCLLGVGAKETLVAAPLLVLVYDRTFLAGSFREAWRRRGKVHLALFATWVPLLWLADALHRHGGENGFGHSIGVLPYALTQLKAVALYLGLLFWPDPLVLDYGTPLLSGWEVVPYALLIVPLLAATGWALWKRPQVGFLGFWFFILLAPSSSFIPIVQQTIAEHRVYLALAAPIALVVLGVYRWWGRASLLLWPLLVLLLMWVTWLRNDDYRSELSIWETTFAHAPDHARTRYNYGTALAHVTRYEEAIEQFDAALRFNPDYQEVHNNLGRCLMLMGRFPEALQHGQAAIRLNPGDAEAQNNLGNDYFCLGRMDEAIGCYREAIRLQPRLADAWSNLGAALVRSGRAAESVDACQEAIRLAPTSVNGHMNLGIAFLKEQRFDEAIVQCQEVLRLQPGNEGACFLLGQALAAANRFTEAKAAYGEALRLNPNDAAVSAALEALKKSGKN